MKTTNEPKQKEQQPQQESLPYETPAVIHESLITTRAGTPAPFDDNLDPADLFGR
jgi:hypothetical protein